MKNKAVDSCNAIIICGNKILLFRRDNKPDIPNPDTWTLPGGGVDDGETPEEAIKRELVEEVSKTPERLEFLFKRKKEDGKINYMYGAFINKGEAHKYKLGNYEGQDVAFFTLNEALKLNLPPQFKEFLETNFLLLKKIFKTQFFDVLLKQEIFTR